MAESGRARYRVGREATYYPTDAEAATGNDDAGAEWPATITKVNLDGTVNLHVLEGDGGFIAKTNVSENDRKGGFSFRVRGGVR